MRVPQVIVTLGPEGQFVAELPGSQATRRRIELSDEGALETLKRILQAQVLDRTEIGLDGAPTGAQVKHWELHGQWADSRCRFCIAEGRAKSAKGNRQRRTETERRPDGVEIKRVLPGQKGKAKVQETRKSAEEMGL